MVSQSYDRVARIWDRSFVSATDELRGILLEKAALRPGERVLDAGTGTGAAAFLAAQQVGTAGCVVGIDVSSGMLAKARTKAERAGVTNVTFRRMDGCRLGLPTGSFDAVISSFGTPEGLYDGEAVFREWLRVLRPGGRLCFVENPGIVSFYKILKRVSEKHEVKDPSPTLAAERRIWERIREERAHAPPIIGDEPAKVAHLMRVAGFRRVRVTTRRSTVVLPSAQTIVRLFLHWGLAEEYADMPPKGRTAFRRDFLRALRPYETSEGLRLPARANFFLGQKSARAR